MRAVLVLLVGLCACLERTSGESQPLDPAFLEQIGKGSGDGVSDEGPTVTARGQVLGLPDRQIEVEISLPDESAEGGFKRLGKVVVDGPGDFEVQLPASQERVYLSMFQDEKSDGPDAADPFFRQELKTGTEDLVLGQLTLVVGTFTNLSAGSAPEHQDIPHQQAPAGAATAGAAEAGAAGGPTHEERPAAAIQPFAELPGPQVKVRGLVTGGEQAPVDLDVRLPGPEARLGKLLLAGPGEFELILPREAGEVVLEAFQDPEGDGPSAGDPFDRLELQVGELDVDGVVLELVVGARGAASGAGTGTQAGNVAAPGTRQAPFADHAGPTVVISGEIVSDADGAVDLDLRVPEASAQGGVKEVGKLLLAAPGPFRLEVPQGMGELRLEAFQDPGKDGPDASDAFGAKIVRVGDVDLLELRIVLVQGARGSGEGHAPVAHKVAAVGESAKVDFAELDRPINPAGVGPFANHEGEFVRLVGSVASATTLPVDLDLWVEDAAAPGGMRNQGKVVLIEPGAFELKVPRACGRLAIEAFQDEDVDGPTEKDAFVRLELVVGTQDQEGLRLELQKTGGLAQGGAPPTDSATPFDGAEGPMVTLSGLVAASGDGTVDVDVRVPDASAPGGMRQEGKLRLAGPGAFEIQVPAGTGLVELEAFQDMDANGPDDVDPYGRVSVDIQDRGAEVKLDLVPGGRALAAAAGAPTHQGSNGAAAAADPGEANPFPSWDGETVTISGTVVYAGTERVDIDLFKTDATAPGGRSIAGKLKVKAGDFSFPAPRGFGPMEVQAFVDVDGDGPSGGDPVGTFAGNPLQVGTQDIDGIEIRFAVSGKGG